MNTYEELEAQIKKLAENFSQTHSAEQLKELSFSLTAASDEKTQCIVMVVCAAMLALTQKDAVK